MPPRAGTTTIEERQTLVYLAYAKDSVDDKTLADLLFKQAKLVYEKAMLREAQSLGYDVQNVQLRTRSILQMMRKRANMSAKQVNATYNDELRDQVAKITADNPDANRQTLSKQIREWDAGRVDWKAGQVATTEAFTHRTAAKTDFHRLNGLDTQWYFEGPRACPQCQEVASRNPYTPEQMAAMREAPHPACQDVWVSEVEGSGSMPAADELWLGG